MKALLQADLNLKMTSIRQSTNNNKGLHQAATTILEGFTEQCADYLSLNNAALNTASMEYLTKPLFPNPMQISSVTSSRATSSSVSKRFALVGVEFSSPLNAQVAAHVVLLPFGT
eukprot:4343619-Amphidinium_carterae.1